MTGTAERVLKELKGLTPADLAAVGAEVSQLLALSSKAPSGTQEGVALGRVLRPEPVGGHPGGSLEPDDAFFQILNRIENERHRRLPRQAPALDA